MEQIEQYERAEDINVSYEKALQLAPPQLRKKIQHSVELIRKAEKIALMYDPENGFYNTFSGGKDSQTLYHIVKMSGVKFQTYMSLTSVDPAAVIRFVKTEYPSVVRQKPEMSIFQRAVERGILPTMRVRWCCADFKESTGAGKVTLIGIRKEESARRAKRHEVEVSNRKFSGDLDEFLKWRDDEIVRKQNRKSKRKINEDEFSVISDNEVRCINGKDSILISPIFDWNKKDVWYFLNNIIKAPHCKLYDEGESRIGCILCPMATFRQKLKDIERYPHVKRNWIKAIKEIRNGGGLQRRLYMAEHPSRLESEDDATKKEIWNKNCPPPTARLLWGNKLTIHHYGKNDTGQWSEDEIAEAIFDWWISGKPYKQWYAEKYLQLKINFNNKQG